jgi:hypothetical protein
MQNIFARFFLIILFPSYMPLAFERVLISNRRISYFRGRPAIDETLSTRMPLGSKQCGFTAVWDFAI